MKEGETTLIELDAYVDGYFCDMTRTMAAGKPSEKAVELWEIVCEQLKSMMSLVKAGTPVKEICGLAREIAANHGYSGKDNFVHNPGHGTGLQLHDLPTIHVLSDEVLEEGMVLALEPHVYIPDVIGMRMEEDVVVTKDGFELLTHFPLEL